MSDMTILPPIRHHLDRRAQELIEAGVGDGDDLLNTVELCEWLGVSVAWAEIGRVKGYGPPWIALSTRRIRYRRRDVLTFLEQRTHRATSEYDTRGAGRKAGSKVVDGRVVEPADAV
jgi:hypothetical protein